MPNILKKVNKGYNLKESKPRKSKLVKSKTPKPVVPLRQFTVASKSVVSQKSSNKLKAFPLLRLTGV